MCFYMKKVEAGPRPAFKIAATEVIVDIDRRNVDYVCLTSTWARFCTTWITSNSIVNRMCQIIRVFNISCGRALERP